MEQYHPIYNFIYFGLVIGCSMFFMHPICLGISLMGALLYTIRYFGWKRARAGLGGLACLMLITAVMNPAFSHQGVTVLMYLPTGNILTMESILYGMAAACMLAATLLWFRLMSEILTTDKIIYLFGRVFPVLGLILSMILGFIPKIQRKLFEIRTGRQRTWSTEHEKEEQKETSKTGNVLTCYLKKGKKMCLRRWRRLRHGIENLSVLITWVLEDAVELADSMKSRGYGLEGRTSYTIYRFTKRDARGLARLLVKAGYIILGGQLGGLTWEYYPISGGAGFQGYSVSLYLVYLLMCLTPVLEDLAKERKWNRLKSVI